MTMIDRDGSAAASARDDAEDVKDLHRRWVFGWERADAREAFAFRETFAAFYDWSAADVILYDDFDAQHRAARSAAEYGAIWEPGFNAMRSVRHVIVEEPAVIPLGDLAASRLVFVARLESLAGVVTCVRTTSSLVLRRVQGSFRIVREHNSSVVVPVERAEALLADAATPSS